MRNLHIPSRSPAYAQNAMVATSHPDATRLALEIIQKGGNAFDAAICAAAILGVVEAHSTGIGGDCFCIFYSQKENKVKAINGSGNAISNIDYNKIQVTANNTIDPYCTDAVTIPGAVAAWSKINQDYGSLSMQEILSPAINLAETGYIVADVIADMWKREVEKLKKDNDCKKTFLKGNDPYKPGEIHLQPDLGKTLREISKTGKEGFYSGWVAEDMVEKLKSLGGRHTLNDFSNLNVEYVDPISITYRGYDIYECPPNGQGIVALMILNILQEFDVSSLGPDSFERIHLEAEATKIAFHHRNKYLGDPKFINVPVEKLLSREYSKKLSKMISFKKTIKELEIYPLQNNKDTVYISVVDKDRNCVSFINSIFHPFGSGIVSSKSGVLLHNRGASFNLDKNHPNFYEPNKRPMHTIIPGLALKNQRPIMPFGVMGAHYQPVGQSHFLTNVIDYNMDVQLALDHKRSFFYDNVLSLEKTFSTDIIKLLNKCGHKTDFIDIPHGGGQAIMINSNNILVGGSDPRKDGIALGF
ncbi:MAG: putative gamma-glutamyltransferase YwrD [Alphaproteobacteria bacterium MarineAlpha9_Bin4]|nr:MAG: putative gamma-glutamyltransferase YwrD [Alphaproteobacteria bacterium MarineAlpha9_Bin4]